MATYRCGVARSRIAASQLVAGAGVSGSSPLVASRAYRRSPSDTALTRAGTEAVWSTGRDEEDAPEVTGVPPIGPGRMSVRAKVVSSK
jgi:hypothetical protein